MFSFNFVSLKKINNEIYKKQKTKKFKIERHKLIPNLKKNPSTNFDILLFKNLVFRN